MGVEMQTWIMFLCYMFSFGVELIVNGNIVTYFVETFDMPQTRASTIGAVFGLLNICMRSFGGLWSDIYCERFGIRGRLHALFQQTFIMGVALIVFSTLTNDNCTSGGLLAVLIWWGSFTNMTEGATFGVVPYVLPNSVGKIYIYIYTYIYIYIYYEYLYLTYMYMDQEDHNM